MAVAAYAGVTDWDWFQQLRAMSRVEPLDEVNFWIPSGRAFKAITPGDSFLFKLHKKAASGANVIAGGGVFVRSLSLPVSLAWDCFGLANGVAGLDEMRERIAKYARTSIQLHPEPQITCVMLASPVLFDEHDWITIKGWKDNIVSGRGLDDARGEDAEILRHFGAVRVYETLSVGESPARYRDALARVRLGQGTFRALIQVAYGSRCAVTGAKAVPTLEAAHIVPYQHGGEHKVVNGLLLRSDVHTLFDRGYVTVTPDHEFRASDRLRDEFNNGAEYYALDGTKIALPRDPREHPDPDLLAWHSEQHGFAA